MDEIDPGFDLDSRMTATELAWLWERGDIAGLRWLAMETDSAFFFWR